MNTPMTPEQKIIAIAEFEGWKLINSTGQIPVGMKPPFDRPAIECVDALPPYLTSRDAICGAVARLSDAKLAKFAEHLQEVCHYYCVGVVPDYRRHLTSLARLTLATPAQLADALLLTLGHEI